MSHESPPSSPACITVRRELASLLYDELDPSERERLEGHLEHCAECRRVRDELGHVQGLLAAWPDPRDDVHADELAAALASKGRGRAPHVGRRSPGHEEALRRC